MFMATPATLGTNAPTNVMSPPFGLPDSFWCSAFSALLTFSPALPKVCMMFSRGCSWAPSSVLCALLSFVPYRAQLSSHRGAFKLSLPIPLSVSLTMADAYVWVFAYFPHPFRPNQVIQAFWKEERQGSAEAWRAGVSPPPGCTPDTASSETKQDATGSSAVPVFSTAAPSRSPTKCIGLDWDSSSGDDGTYQVSSPPPPPDRSCTPTTTSVCLPPGRRPTPTTAWQGSVQLILHCDSALTRSSLAVERSTAIGSTLGASNNPPRRADMTLLWRTCTMTANGHQTTLPEPHRCSALALRHVVCVQEGAGFVTDSSLAENFHVITQHHCAVLLNKDTSKHGHTCTPIQVPSAHKYSSWAIWKKKEETFLKKFRLQSSWIQGQN